MSLDREDIVRKTFCVRQDQMEVLSSFVEQFASKGLPVSVSALVRMAIDEGLADAAAKWFFQARANQEEDLEGAL